MALKSVYISWLKIEHAKTLPAYKGILFGQVQTAIEGFTITVPDAADCGLIALTKVGSDNNEAALAFTDSQTVNGQASVPPLKIVGDSYFLLSYDGNWLALNPRIVP